MRQAKEKGADLALIHEFFALAHPFEGNPLIAHFARLAAELGVVLPLSYFERAGQYYFNSLAVIGADNRVLGNCRSTASRHGPTKPSRMASTCAPRSLVLVA